MRFLFFLVLSLYATAIHPDRTGESSESPWQGTWTGSETSSFGQQLPVRVKIRVTGSKVSGSWQVRGAGLKPITGQVDGETASITILQGGSSVKATLSDKNTIKYSGLRGYGTLTRQVDHS